MRKVFLLLSAATLFAICGCSRNHQRPVAKNAPAVVQAPAAPAPAATPSVAMSVAALPVPSIEQAGSGTWRSEGVKDQYGDAVALKATSLDGKYDLVVLRRGANSFVSFARHGRWESAHQQAGEGKLMYLRVRFEDGEEKRIEWDEIGFATERVCSVLWSYPAKAGAPIGQQSADSVGGDEVLLQDMMKHKTMVLEVEPGVTAQFNTAGLTREMETISAPKAPTVLAATQDAQ